MLKRIITYWKTVWKLAAPITHARLMGTGFEYYHPFYMLKDLAIETDIKTNKYFFVDENGNQKRIKIMQDVAKLIYGLTQYGK